MAITIEPRSIVDGVEHHIIDGKEYKLLGYIQEGGRNRCPTEKCDAFCCKTASVFPDASPPCEYLTDKLSCYFQDRGGIGAKPFGCVAYPRNQADIDAMNKNAVGDFRCHLRFEAV